jgi:hypothetical protein
LAESAPVLNVPLVACVPLHAPLAVQVVALAALQLRGALDPVVTAAGVALNVTVGAGMVTVTVADCVALPPAPVHVSVNVDVAARATVVKLPVVACAPLHAPLALQVVALVLVQFKLVLEPDMTVEGVALSVTVGSGAVTTTVADCAVLPPAPVQVKV